MRQAYWQRENSREQGTNLYMIKGSICLTFELVIQTRVQKKSVKARIGMKYMSLQMFLYQMTQVFYLLCDGRPHSLNGQQPQSLPEYAIVELEASIGSSRI